MNAEPLTPTFVQEYLRRIADIDVSLDEAAAIVPLVEANRSMLAVLERFDVQEGRPATTFDPVSPTVPSGGA
jgi:hypothetical protein